MVRGLGFTAALTVLIALLLLVPPTYCSNPPCAHSSSCGNIPNISFPFRLNSDPENCGDSFHVLSCENNRTVLDLYVGKYYVQEISYNNYTIRIVDPSIHKDNYFSFSTLTYYSLSRYYLYFYGLYTTYLQKGTKANYRHLELSRSVVLMSCEKPVNSPLYLDTSTCNYNENSSSISDSKRRYRYVKVGRTNASEVEESCQVEKMFRTSWPTNNDDPNISCTDVLNELAYGFEISWLGKSCYLDDANHVQCNDDSTGVLHLIRNILIGLGYLFGESAHWWDRISYVWATHRISYVWDVWATHRVSYVWATHRISYYSLVGELFYLKKGFLKDSN